MAHLHPQNSGTWAPSCSNSSAIWTAQFFDLPVLQTNRQVDYDATWPCRCWTQIYKWWSAVPFRWWNRCADTFFFPPPEKQTRTTQNRRKPKTKMNKKIIISFIYCYYYYSSKEWDDARLFDPLRSVLIINIHQWLFFFFFNFRKKKIPNLTTDSYYEPNSWQIFQSTHPNGERGGGQRFKDGFCFGERQIDGGMYINIWVTGYTWAPFVETLPNIKYNNKYYTIIFFFTSSFWIKFRIELISLS